MKKRLLNVLCAGILLAAVTSVLSLTAAAEIPENAVLITDVIAYGYSYDGETASYDEENGTWTPVEYDGDYCFFSVFLQEGDTVYFEVSDNPEYVEIYDWYSYKYDGEYTDTTGSLTAPEDGVYTFWTDEEVTVRAYLTEAEFKSSGDPIILGGVEMADGDYLYNGADEVSSEAPAEDETGYAHYDDGVLTLNNYVYEGEGHSFTDPYDYDAAAALFFSSPLKIVTFGSNVLNLTCDDDIYPVIIAASDSLTFAGEGTLSLGSDDSYETADSICVYDGSTVAVRSGTLNINAYDGIEFDYDGKLFIAGGSLNINAYDDGIAYLEYAAICGGTVTIDANYGLYDCYSVDIYGGSVTIDSEYGDGIDAANNVGIYGGTVNIDAYDCGIIADNVEISGGTVNIYSYDDNGLYADNTVKITGGTVNIDAYDSGIFATYIKISGGITYIKSEDIFAVSAEYDVVVDTDIVEIRIPADGYIDYYSEYYTILDGNDYPAYEVYIIPECSHEWSDDYSFDEDAHWRTCTEEDCAVNKLPKACDDYGEHTSASGICEDCGYNTAKDAAVTIDNIGLADGEYLSVSGKITTAKPAEGYAYYKDGVLTLDNFTWETRSLYDNDVLETRIGGVLTVKLIGENALTAADDAIVLSNTGLLIKGSGSLTLDAGEDGIDVSSFTDALEKSFTLESGTVIIRAGDNGIEAYTDVEIKGGTLSITSESDEAIYVNDITNEGTGLPNYGNVTISGGNVTLTANSDGIDVNAFMDEEGNIIGGNITISGGNITITAESSGLESSADTTITGGMITITADTDKDGDPALYVMGTLTVDVPIILPENGCILVTNDFETIADSEGNIAYSVKLGNAQNSGEGSASVYEPESTFDYEHWQKSLYMMFTRRYLITASAAEGGTITNEGTVNTRYGTSVTYHITPDEGYEIVSVIVNGEDIGAVEEYTFKGISADHTISAVFAKVQ